MTLWASVLFVLSQVTPGSLVHLGRYALSAVLSYVKREPVRVFAWAIVALVFLASTLTGVPLAVIIGQVVAVAAAAEKVRSVVTPVLSDLLERNASAPEGGEAMTGRWG